MVGRLDLGGIEAVVVDMDGVLWIGDRPLPGLEPFFGFLAEWEIPFVLATNNASRTPEFYVDRMAGFGVTIAVENVLTSSLATAEWMSGKFPEGAKVFIVGQEGLYEAMAGAGFTILEDASEDADAVVGGIDFTLTYDKIRDAVLLIGRGARFIGTNGDLTYPSEAGMAPGGGAILAAIQAATGVKPTIVGKPESPMFEAAVARLGRDRDRTAIVGDRLETDILGGHHARLKTILVTTGIDTPSTVREKAIIPDDIYDSLDSLTAAWRDRV